MSTLLMDLLQRASEDNEKQAELAAAAGDRELADRVNARRLEIADRLLRYAAVSRGLPPCCCHAHGDGGTA